MSIIWLAFTLVVVWVVAWGIGELKPSMEKGVRIVAIVISLIVLAIFIRDLLLVTGPPGLG